MPDKKSLKENSGAMLWEQAKKIIPGGNQLLSKRAEMFLPELWPAYYKKSLGCEVWDLDDHHYYDMSIMGIGTSPLGYAHPEVTQAVINAVSDGCMSSLNCFEEVQLAEKLIDIHPWADGARFSRTGGEACSMAVLAEHKQCI
ncbi:aminotransferase class III-fold pyridoxal phosphate-dependent enzyme, partial [Pseudoalteromonas sp. NBT06-2]|uniref:aminotransferase class III-fold pyridoxal phosphate-dependent enzyme n=1 Tax=Pseudoalteromonas sp. NBT06-2 TaxID=2025950 RepID=UPI001140CEFA